MRDALFRLRPDSPLSLQAQVREMIVDAILSGQMPPGDALPSCRRMAQRLAISRNSVVYAYQQLVDTGYLVSRERSGFYVADDVLEGRGDFDILHGTPGSGSGTGSNAAPQQAPEWNRKLRIRPSDLANIEKPENWQSFPYPFIYGQVDPAIFPLSEWRDCSRQSHGGRAFNIVTDDVREADDPLLVEQIVTRLLPRRGVMARPEEVLVTMGAQNALYLLVSLLVKPHDTVIMGDPGYPDFRNIARLRTNRLRTVPVDGDGLPVDRRLEGADYIFLTPSHHSPTTVTMPMDRRQEILDFAMATDAILIEDDYEPEANFISEPRPALKSMDRVGRVIYVGSLSKTLFPGLRLGYLVASPDIVAELRVLRRLMLRHPPLNNQHTAGIFIAQGHHDALVKRLHRIYKARWHCMKAALARHLPGMSEAPTFGGTSFWVRGPAWLDSGKLAHAAMGKGVLLEPGGVQFALPESGKNYFRLGFSSIAEDKIEPGVALIGKLIRAARTDAPG